MSDYFLVACLASFVVGLSKGGLPSIGMLAVPILSLMISPFKAASLLLPIFVISDMVGIYLYRKQFSAENLRLLIPAGILGVIAGWALVAYISDDVLSFLIGMIGISFCLNIWLRKTPTQAQPANRLKAYFWGTVSGFTSFISHSGAPPFQVYMLPQRLPKLVFAGTSTLFFAVVNASKIWPYQAIQPYSNETLYEASTLIPAAIGGTLLGAYLTKRLQDRWFFLLVQIGLLIVSLKLVASAIQHWLI
jgi:uncharacterized membrane protein YfcA